jgi:protocatechuate 3,4-dioxygenase alpha subunit
MTALQVTPSQTAGPYLAIGLCREPQNRVVPEGSDGAIWIRGMLLDGAGDPIPDGLVEIWQADATGAYRPDFGFGRCGTHETGGSFAFLTVKPGRVPDQQGTLQAPHLTVFVFARGILKPLHTRMYFADEDEANAADPVLSAIDPSYHAALIAQREDDGLSWDIHVQGEGQPAFFAL